MKKVLLLALALVVANFANAQEEESKGSSEGNQTSKGKWLIEANTGNAMLGNTGFYFTSSDGESTYNLGLDGGYFIMDDLAIKGGLGYGGDSATDSNIFSYRLGAEYYVIGKIPVSVDLTGASIKDAQENPMWLGLGAGYAIFIGDMVSIEPGLRYNLSLNEDFTDEGVFQFNVGFAIHL